MIRGDKSASILIIAVLATAYLSLSSPGALPFPDIFAFLALCAALGLFWLQLTDGPFARAAAAAALAFFAIHPTSVALLKSGYDAKLIASLAGLAATLTILRWNPEPRWHAWAALLPAAGCVVLHRAGIGAALVAVAVCLLFDQIPDLLSTWPAWAISVAALALHFSEPLQISGIPGAAMSALAGFALPFGAASEWNMLEGLIALAVVIGLAVYNHIYFRMPAVTFGLVWYFVMIVLVPAEPLAALPGLALALSAGIAGLAAGMLPSPLSSEVPAPAARAETEVTE